MNEVGNQAGMSNGILNSYSKETAMILKNVRFILLALTVVFSVVTSTSATVDIEGLEIQPHPDNPDRVLLRADALIEDVPGQIDRHMGGHLGVSCSKRIFWNGDTSINQGGSHLELTSTLRYEQWLCAILKTRLLRSTHAVNWRLDITEGARLDNLIATATLTNIQDFPDSLEEWLGLRVRTTVRIEIPAACGECECYDLVDELLPVAERFEFHPQNVRDVLVKATFSAPRNLSPILRCF